MTSSRGQMKLLMHLERRQKRKRYFCSKYISVTRLMKFLSFPIVSKRIKPS